MTSRAVSATGSIFIDARGSDRALRVTWHHEAGLVVLSMWRDNVCAGTFRLPVDAVPDLIDLLRSGLEVAYRGASAGVPAPRGVAAPPQAETA